VDDAVERCREGWGFVSLLYELNVFTLECAIVERSRSMRLRFIVVVTTKESPLLSEARS
jgi:hypothetical protein